MLHGALGSARILERAEPISDLINIDAGKSPAYFMEYQ